MRFRYAANTYEDYSEPTAEMKLIIAENQRRHEEARAAAAGSGIYVICDSLLYAPSGDACASLFTHKAGQRESVEELVRLANLQLKGA